MSGPEWLEAIRELWTTWRTWSAPGKRDTENRYPRPFHEYPLAQSELFRLRTVEQLNLVGPARLPNTVPPRDVSDGIDLGGLKFRARTMTLIATDGQNPLSFDFDSGRGQVPTSSNPSGTIVVDVQGLHPGGVYWRRFDLTPFKAIEINCQTWRRVKVRPLFSTLSGFDLVAIFTEEPNTAGRRDRVYFAQNLQKAVPSGTTQVYEVPPGARSLISVLAQPDAEWQSYTENGLRAEVAINAGAGIAVGTRELVNGTQLALGVNDPGGLVIWEIEL